MCIVHKYNFEKEKQINFDKFDLKKHHFSKINKKKINNNTSLFSHIKLIFLKENN